MYVVDAKNIFDYLAGWSGDLTAIIIFLTTLGGAVGGMWLWLKKKAEKERADWFAEQFNRSVQARDEERKRHDDDTTTTLKSLQETLIKINKNQDRTTKKLDDHEIRISVLERENKSHPMKPQLN